MNHNEITERLDLNDGDFSEIMFSLMRYYSISKYCKNKEVVDIACGTGYGSFLLSNVSKIVYGIDINSEVIEKNKEKYNKENLIFKVGSTDNIPIENKKIDVIVSCETVEHISSEQFSIFLDECLRVLKKNGIVFITTPNLDKTATFETRNPYHINEMSMQFFENELKKYFKFVEIYCLDLNLVTYMRKVHNDSENLSVISVKNWKLNDGVNTNTIYMAAVCSNKKLSKVDVSSVFIDEDKTLNEQLWNKVK